MRVRRNIMNIKKSINIYSFKYIILSYPSFMYKDDINLWLGGVGTYIDAKSTLLLVSYFSAGVPDYYIAVIRTE